LVADHRHPGRAGSKERSVPSTIAGRRAGWLLVGGGGLFATFLGLVGAGQRGGDTFFSNPLLAAAILGAGGAAIASGALGVVAWRRGDRSVVVVAAILAGLVTVWWTVAEIAFPH
jgi:hypothetical protein